MGSALCEKCLALFRQFRLRFGNICKEVAHEIRVFFAELAECTCLDNNKELAECTCLDNNKELAGCTCLDNNKELAGCTCHLDNNKELADRRRRRRVSHRLPLLNPDDQTHALNDECFEALDDLTASGTADLQHTAAVYYLYLSHRLESPLPGSFVAPLMSLLLSPHPDVQKTAGLSLVNLLVKRNVCKELVFEMGALAPLLEMLRCGDTVARCHACACVTLLASSESNSDALVSEGVMPLLALAKSYDPHVQQNAAWVLLNLTQSVWSRRVLCAAGAVPVLAVLLQCSDSRVQFYGCSALCNLAADPRHHAHLLRVGNRYLLRSLLTLMSSPVQKNACQACKCLQMLCRNAAVREQLLELDCAWPLKTLLSSSVLERIRSALGLLSTLSTHPTYHELLASEGLCDAIGRTLRRHGSSCDVVASSCTAVESLSGSCLGQQALVESDCFPGLLHALVSPDTPEDALLRLTSCLHHLMSSVMTSEEVLRLVTLSGPDHNLQITYNSAAIISKLQMNGEVMGLLRPHYSVLMENILCLVKSQEVKCQHLGITTLCKLMKDADFSATLSGSELETEVKRLNARTEETRQLLSMILPASSQGTLSD
ncbi:hypothetical protein NHX12_019914 [Muraenolepis orangiensis]|uniref:Vacuolar protein 8 n=1 Tax=Muraenolepis orangiensis TaxID=630683 RepID=A0A9Q0EY85_9TELE|nr:hypothetical protein NHX12_019914 [Muraenolepis orangiensis]